MKTKFTSTLILLKIILVVIFTTLNVAFVFAQDCDNAVFNGSFRGNISGWTTTGSGSTWYYDSYAKSAMMTHTSGTRVLSQDVSNARVEDGYITLFFYANFMQNSTYRNRLYINWNGVNYLDLNAASSSTTMTVNTLNGAVITSNITSSADYKTMHVKLKIPYTGASPASGTLTFNFANVSGYNGYYRYISNVFIPIDGECSELSSGIQPIFDCEPNIGYLFQNVNSAGISASGTPEVYQVNLLDGSNVKVKDLLIDTTFYSFSEINSVGFNAVDGYMWAYRMGTNQLVRIGSDWSVEFIEIDGLHPIAYANGEIDRNGIMYLARNGATFNQIQRVDLNTQTLLAPLTTSSPIYSIDFAINPVDDYLYALNNSGGTRTLVRINTTTGDVSSLGSYASLPDAGYGAGFFDNDGNYFVSANGIGTGGGNIYKFTAVQNATGTSATTPVVTFMAAGPQTTSNDGARCAYTPVSSFTISGHIWIDANGDAIKASLNEPYTNVGTSATNGLWVNLVNSDGEIVSTSPVGRNGKYYLTAPNGTYNIILTYEQKEIGTTIAQSELPDNWVNTGTNTYGIADSDNESGIINGIVITGTDISNLDFGIQQLPDSDVIAHVIDQPEVDDVLSLNGIGANPPLMSGSDLEDGWYNGNIGDVRNPEGVVIASLPTNGELWYDGTIVSTSDLNNTIFADPSLFSVRFTGSDYVSLSFEFAFVDAAGKIDPTPATYSLNWDAPLNMTLLSFEAKVFQNSVVLDWLTENEQNIHRFELERSSDSRDWKKIGSVLTNGMNNLQSQYQFIDIFPMNGNNYYRLKVVNSNNSFTYSKVNSIWYQASSELSFAPNPIKEYIYINGLNGGEHIEVMDHLGKVIYNKKNLDDNSVTIDFSAFNSGNYIVRIKDQHKTIKIEKVIKL